MERPQVIIDVSDEDVPSEMVSNVEAAPGTATRDEMPPLSADSDDDDVPGLEEESEDDEEPPQASTRRSALQPPAATATGPCQTTRHASELHCTARLQPTSQVAWPSQAFRELAAELQSCAEWHTT